MEQPNFIDYRSQLWEQYQLKIKQEEKSSLAQQPIKIKLPDGSVVEGLAGASSPLSIASEIKKAEKIIAAKIDGVLSDLNLPLKKDCSLEFLSIDHPEAQLVIRHSSALLLGQALELKYGCTLCIGSALSGDLDHFYFDVHMPNKSYVRFLPITNLISLISILLQNLFR